MIPSLSAKQRSSYEPSQLWRNCVSALSKYRRYVVAFLVLLLSAYVFEYWYLTSLYLVDETFEVDVPKEWTIDQKLTIRVVAPPDPSAAAIRAFVEHYSICQSVHEIQILWQDYHPPAAPSGQSTHTAAEPPASSGSDTNSNRAERRHATTREVNRHFVFKKTHSRVTVVDYSARDSRSADKIAAAAAAAKEKSDGGAGRRTDYSLRERLVMEAQWDRYYAMLYEPTPIETDAVLTLDVDVRLSCADVTHSLSVWSSSRDSIAGFYPRLHRSIHPDGTKSAHPSYEFLPSWWFVWWHQRFSIVLPAGALLHRRYFEQIQSYSKHSPRSEAQSEQRREQAAGANVHHLAHKLHTFLKDNRECAEMAYPLWPAAMAALRLQDKASGNKKVTDMSTGIQPPIWIDVPLSYENSPIYPPGSPGAEAEKARREHRSYCLTGLMEVLQTPPKAAALSPAEGNSAESVEPLAVPLPYTYYKSVRAKTQLVW